MNDFENEVETENEANIVRDMSDADVSDALNAAYMALSEPDKAEIDLQIAALIGGVRKRFLLRKAEYEATHGKEASRNIGRTAPQFGPIQALQVLAALGMFYVSTPLQIYVHTED